MYSGFKLDPLYGVEGLVFYGWRGQPAYYWLAGFVLLPTSGSDAGTRAFVLRFLSILLNTGAIYFTYRMAKELFPKERLIYLSAPMAMAMLPMFTFTGMSINPDNLAILIVCIFLWLAVRMIVRGYDVLSIVSIIFLVMAGLLTKRTTAVTGILLILLPVLILFREPAKTTAVKIFRLVPILVMPIFLFGVLPIVSWLSLKFGSGVDAVSVLRSNFSGLAPELHKPIPYIIGTFWGNFGWMELPLKGEWTRYTDLQKIWRLPIYGYLVMGISALLHRRGVLTRVQLIALSFLATSVAGAILIVLLFQQVQARYLWPVLGASALLFCVGTIRGLYYVAWIAQSFGIGKNVSRFGRWLSLGAFIILALAMFSFDLSLLFNLIIPRYYSDFKLSGVSVRDPIASAVIHMIQNFDYLRMTDSEKQQILLWRPSLLNSGFFYSVLFAGYFLAFFSFIGALTWQTILNKEDNI